MKKRTKRLLATLLASVMILQQGSTVGVLATEETGELPAETIVTEAPTPETQAPEVLAPAPETQPSETQAQETKAPETQMSETEATETQAPETKAPETQAPETKAPETQATEPATEVKASAPETAGAPENVTETPTEAGAQTSGTEETAGTQSETPDAPVVDAGTDVTVETVTETAAGNETETEAPKTDFIYEDARVKITATAQPEAKLPQDAQIHADYMQPGTPEYQAAAIALEAAYAGQNVVLDYVFYDIYFTAESAGDGRIEPEAGTVTVSMQFKQPELKPEADAEVQTYDVVHVENGKAQEVPSNVQTTGDGSVASVGFTSDSFSPYAVVMTVEEQDEVVTIGADGEGETVTISSSLSDFFDSDQFNLEGGTWVDGKLILVPGQKYSVQLYFSEADKSLKFNKESGATLTYQFPQQLTPSPSEGTFDMTIRVDNVDHVCHGNKYMFDDDTNTLTVQFSEETLEQLRKVDNGWFKLTLEAVLSSDASGETMTWGTDTTTEVEIDNAGKVTVEKTATEYDAKTGKFKFEVKVKSTGNTKDVVIDDTIGDDAVLSLSDDSITVVSDKNADLSWEKVTGSRKSNGKGFTATIPEMQDGETVTFTYYTNVNYDALEGDTFTVDETKNTVTATPKDGTTSNDDWDYGGKTAYDVTPNKKGELEGTTENGKQKIKWTVKVNEDAKVYAGGKRVKDTLVPNSKIPVKYTETGVTVNRYSADGHLLGTNFYTWESLEVNPDSTDSWELQLPEDEGETPCWYEIIYYTEADVSDILQPGTVSNKFTYDGHEVSGSQAVNPEEDFDVTKTHNEDTMSAESVEFTVTVDIPKRGINRKLTVTDVLPEEWGDSWFCDHYTGESLSVVIETIDGGTVKKQPLQEDTDYTISLSGGESNVKQTMVVDFSKSLSRYFGESEKERRLVLTYKTTPNPDWPTGSAHIHKNTVTVDMNGDTDSDTDTYFLTPKMLQKKCTVSSGLVTSDGLPYFKYMVLLGGVSEKTIKIEDQFDTKYFEVYDPNNGGDTIFVRSNDTLNTWDTWDPVCNYYYGMDAGNRVEYENTATGATFTITPATKEDESFYNYYGLTYFLKVKNAEVLEELENLAIANDGTKPFTNTAGWSGEKATVTVDFKVNPLKKEIIQEANGGNSYTAKYRVTINEGKKQLNEGADMEVEDTFGDHMILVPGSMVVSVNGTKTKWDYETKPGGHGFTMLVPDGKTIILEYEVKITGTEGEVVKYNNKVELKGSYSANAEEKNVTITSSGFGGGSNIVLYIYKYGDNQSEPLAGAKFQLYIVDGDTVSAVKKSSSNEDVIFTTGEDGKVMLTGTTATGFDWKFEVGKTYELKEIEAPEGYALLPEPIRFEIVAVPTGIEGQYANGDTIGISNKLAEGGSLTIWKATTVPTGVTVPKEFEFTVQDSAKNYYDKVGNVSKDKVTVTVPANGSVEIQNLPFDTYTVTEVTTGVTVPTGYMWTVKVGSATKESATVTLDASKSAGTVAFTNTYTKKTNASLVLKGTKKLLGGELEKNAYMFRITQKPENTKEVVLPADVFNAADGSFKFGEITFDTAGTYEFEVKEVAGTDDEQKLVDYDETTYTVTVKVKDKTDGSGVEIESVMCDSQSLTKDSTDGAYKLPEKVVEEGDTEKATFVNRVKKGSLKIKKTVSKPTDVTAPISFLFTVQDASGNYYNGAGENKGNVKTTITVAAGTEKAVYNLPVGTYTVTEVTEGEGVPKVPDDCTWTVTVNGRTTSTVEVEVSDSKTAGYTPNTAEFLNTYAKKDDASFVLKGTKKLIGGTLAADAYSFRLTQNADDVTKISPLPGDALNNSAGVFTFSEIKFETAGTYTFYVQEVQGDENAEKLVEYDTAKYTVTVEVKEKSDKSGVYIESVMCGSSKLTNTGSDGAYELPKHTFMTEKASFVNRVRKGSLKIKKNVTMDGKPVTGKEMDGTYTFTIKKEDGAFVKTVNITITDGKSTTVTVEDLDPGFYIVTETVPTGMELMDDNSIKVEVIGDNTSGIKTAAFTNNKITGTSIKLGAFKILKAGDTDLPLKGDEFTFSLTEVDEKGQLLEGGVKQTKVANKAEGKVEFEDISYTEAKTHYYLIKEEIPTGADKDGTVIYDEQKYTVTVKVEKKNGALVATPDMTADKVVFTNKKTSVKISKVDVTNSKELAGAHIQILDSKGNVVEEWDSTTAPHEVKGLKTGETYTLRETVAPNGYTVTTDTTFTLKADGTVDSSGTTAHSKDGVLLVEDSLNAISIRKVDETGAAVSGAKLVIKDAADKIVESWTTDGAAHVLSGYGKGKYTLSEIEAPEGYQVSADIPFEVTGTEKAGTVIDLTMTDQRVPSSNNRSLRVTKHLKLDGISSDVGVHEAVYYVALFADEARTQRVSSVKQIVFKNSTTSSVLFNNLGLGTYYVGETDENGTKLVSKVVNDRLIFYPEYGAEGAFTFEGSTTEGVAEFTNVYMELPVGFYLSGRLTITKKLLVGGAEATSNDTYYARVFSDKALTTPACDVLPLPLGGNSSASIMVIDLPIGDTLDSSATYYVAETDKNGTPLDPAAVTEYEISIDKSEVVLSNNNWNQEVVITNDFASEEEYESEFESEYETEVDGTKTAPKTGDDTDYMRYLLLMALSAGTCAAAYGQKRRKKRARR